MAIDSQHGGDGGGNVRASETNGTIHTLHTLDANGQPASQQNHTNGIVCPSSGETMNVQNVITTVMSSTNGDHHSGEDRRDSPEIQTSHPSQVTTTTMVTTMPITQPAVAISDEVDTTHIKMEPQDNMNVIVKQEVVSMGTGEFVDEPT